MSGFSFFSNPNAVFRSFSSFKFGPPVPPKELLIAPYLDKEVLVLLTDDRKVYGCLCCFDEHGNLVLEGARERIIVGDLYCDVPLGLFLIRGETSVLIGELKLGEEELPQHMLCVSEEEIKKAQKVEKEAKYLKSGIVKEMGFLDLD
ncbi:unnamed protein product [Lupinus luteus]|uniref:U6 snRNA-associated Sm-like protein LSm1 n=1 Tax=Lupinus luteus TaxID=3873 RepID=A0AAV1Y942_LUPLU